MTSAFFTISDPFSEQKSISFRSTRDRREGCSESHRIPDYREQHIKKKWKQFYLIDRDRRADSIQDGCENISTSESKISIFSDFCPNVSYSDCYLSMIQMKIYLSNTEQYSTLQYGVIPHLIQFQEHLKAPQLHHDEPD